jgi:hypothetical protein
VQPLADLLYAYQRAQCVPEETVPAESKLVVVLQKVDEAISNIPVRVTLKATVAPKQLSLSHGIRIKSVEYWLKLGEPDQALRELEALPSRAWNHPIAVKARIAALSAIKEMCSEAAHS